MKGYSPLRRWVRQERAHEVAEYGRMRTAFETQFHCKPWDCAHCDGEVGLTVMRDQDGRVYHPACWFMREAAPFEPHEAWHRL